MNTNQTIFEKVALYASLVTVFLLPLLAIPSISIPFDATKMFVLAVGTLVAFIALAVHQLRGRSVTMVRSISVYTIVCVPIVLTISALLSAAQSKSLFGLGIEVGTASTVLLLVLLGYVIAYIARDKSKILHFYTAFIISAVLTALFHVVRVVFGPTALSFGVFTNPVANFIGNWNDVAIYFGLIAVLSMVTISFLSLSRKFKVFLYVSLVASLLLVAYVNFTTVWYILGFVSLALAVTLWNGARSSTTTRQAIMKALLPIVVLVVSIIGVTASTSIGQFVSTNFGINQIDVRPSWQLTFDLAYQTLREDPLLGSGPNTFTSQYLKFKPQAINNTVFWNVDFPGAIGYIPTFAVTGGLASLLLLVVFMVFFVKKGVTVIRQAPSDLFSRYVLLSSFFGAAFLWAMSIFFTPSLVILTLLAVFTGIFLGSYFIDYPTLKKVFVWQEKGIKMVIASVIMGVVILVSLSWLYVYLLKYTASVKFQSALVTLSRNNNDLDVAEKALQSAASLAPHESYYQALSEINVLKINRLISTATSSSEQVVTALQSYITNALAASQNAVNYDAQNYQNYVEFARIYESVMPIQMKDAYENAQRSYAAAINVNQLNPSLYLSLAQLEVARKNYPEAKKYIGAALQVKNNFTDAIFLLSQIQVAEGSIKDAIISSQALVQLNPNNPTALFQLGLLYYNDKNYQLAIESFEKAVTNAPQYSNARYFLGLSYARLNKYTDAIAQFTEIQKFNPDNQEVELILKNLIAGKSPFTDAKPPIDSKPETRKKLPVKDSLDKKTSSQVDTQ